MIDLRPFKDMICRALDKSPDGGSFDEVQKAVINGEAMVWTGEKSIAITDNATAMNVWIFAGDLQENIKMESAAAAHAAHLGFDQMTITNPRKGWAKHLESLGYKRQDVWVKGLK